eukprot:TRINITY_DN11135_c0_g1_i1.p2 TRINITY_DN11135_c0_g1~~TRINITY_DN11135_c0_g1_i1.p2  ORF type:complete len:151 (-),score=8.24 TRINITY_DN11135_c0_g1_i1:81-533(-)
MVLKRLTYEELGRARYYSITADSTADVSGKEQMTAFARVAGRVSGVQARSYFLGIGEIVGHSAVDVCRRVQKMLGPLEPARLLSVSFDGASVMSGCLSGAQLRLRVHLQSNAIWCWCMAHSLHRRAGPRISSTSRQRWNTVVLKMRGASR